MAVIINKKRLLNIAVSTDHRVLYVGEGPPPAGLVKEPHSLIEGELAEWLYMALAGHRFEEHPDMAAPAQAWQARGYLAALKSDGIYRALRVVQRHRNELRPWLGVVSLDEHRCAVLGDEHYQVIELAA